MGFLAAETTHEATKISVKLKDSPQPPFMAQTIKTTAAIKTLETLLKKLSLATLNTRDMFMFAVAVPFESRVYYSKVFLPA